MDDFFFKLFDTSDFPARWNCGTWSEFHGWLHIVSDTAVFLAYTLIPCVIFYFVMQRKEVQFPRVFWLFCGFIFACGTVHLIEAVIFFAPIYRIAGVFKFATAIISWATLVALLGVTPKALKLPTIASLYDQLEKETQTLRETKQQLSETLLELQHAKELTDAIIECVGTGVMVANTDGMIILANESAKQITGLSASDVQQDSFSQNFGMYFPDGNSTVATKDLPLTRALHGEQVLGEEYLLCGPNLVHNKIIRVNASTVTNQTGEHLGAVLAFDDITTLHEQRIELKTKHEETRTELSQANERIGNIVNSISDVIWSAEYDGDQFRFMYFSPRIKTLTGYPATHFLGDKAAYLKILVKEDRENLHSAMDSILSQRRNNIQKEYRIINSKGDIVWVRNRVHAQKEVLTGKIKIFGVLSNIDEEREIREVLAKAERLSALGTLSAGIAHEINNPLGAILLTTEMAKVQLTQEIPSHHVNQTLDKVIDQIMRCSNIVSNVLQFAKNEESEKVATNFMEVAVRARDMVASKARSNDNTIILKNNIGDCTLILNATEFEQVLINLFANAVDASPVQGKILLVIDQINEQELEFSVHDAGPGMDDQTKTRAFDPFFSCRRKSGGTGLGLSMCHSIVARHGGRMDIRNSSELGGAKVCVTMPKPSRILKQATS